MRISHEVPICMLEESIKFNDYDYCLLHLTYLDEQYKNFYKNSKREVLLDNSAFELGDALSSDLVAQGVLELKPTYYVVPDCVNNCDETINRYLEFVKKYPDLPGLKIGVVQGSTFEDLVKCYKFMSAHADKIAIAFGSIGYNDLQLNGKFGRVEFIKYLVQNNIWNNNKPHHLLGCTYAYEFSEPLYRTLNIDTIDTSNPVVLGILVEEYNASFSNTKPKIKLCDLAFLHLSPKQIETIKYNVTRFKEVLK